jgi:16S rRNA (guanine1516-N2)-methyltransferase
MTAVPIVVVAATDEVQRAENLAAKLAIPLFNTLPSPSDVLPHDCVAYLSYRDNCLQLFPANAEQSGPICVDFASHATTYRLQSGGELIVKAVKGRSKNSLRVVDATAGLGRDSFVLAAHGFNVTLIERNAVIAALLDDGLQRVEQSQVSAIAARMRLIHTDALTHFTDLSEELRPDVIYLDPMFAHSEKTALVKKEMRLFRQLFANLQCGDEQTDAIKLFNCARACARLRVVVKRALKAPYLADSAPAYSLTGKAIRFDVYPA